MDKKQRRSQTAIIKASGKYHHAQIIELCREHLKLYPADGIIWLEYAMSLSQLSAYEKANEAFDNATKYCPKKLSYIICNERGRLEQRRGDYAASENWYIKATQCEGTEAFTFVYLGVLYFRWGKLTKAEATLRQVIENNADLVDEAYLNLGGVLVAQERYQEAKECFEKAIQIDPQYKQAKLRLNDVNQVLASKQDVDL